MRDLLEYRSELPLLEHTTYLVSHSLSAMPREAADRLAEFARMWAERGIRSWVEGFWGTPWTLAARTVSHPGRWRGARRPTRPRRPS